MNELHLFAGSGGGILGGMLLGHTCVCAVEIEPYRRQNLLSRQRDGILPKFPIWDDVRTFDGRPWRGEADIVAGGFPCQDISAAGRGEGISGSRSGLWSEMARIVCEVQPSFVFVENSPILTVRGIDQVLGDLAALGYDARWGVLSAADAIWLSGTPCLDHLRERIWILATNANETGLQKRELLRGISEETGRTVSRQIIALDSETPCNSNGSRRTRSRPSQPSRRFGDFESIRPGSENANNSQRIENGRSLWDGRRRTRQSEIDQGRENGTHWWKSEPGVGRVVHGVADRVERLAALGDGQVPAVVELAWKTLSE